jgi:SAM-dependent methyltransferase
MCNVAVIEFFIEHTKPEEFKGKRVLEVGSKYINGSVRPLVEMFLSPKEYVGVDIEHGKFVNIILPVENILDYFNPESFDIVISTELLEHIIDWRVAVNNMKFVLKSGGYIYITTRSMGFPYHGYPYDFWRYELEDMRKIFKDFEIIALKRDHEAPGIFLKAKKPENYVPKDLSDIALYSMILGKRTKDIPDFKDMPLARRLMLRLLSSKAKWLLPGVLLNLLERRYCY